MIRAKLQEIIEFFRKWRYNNWVWRWRNLENLVDDPIDDLKHKVHGMKIFGKIIHLPNWLMKIKNNRDK
jgi:hypothetical protein